MKIALLGDLHVQEKRLDEQLPVLRSIVEEIAQARVDCTVIAGDLTGWAVPHCATIAERNALVGFVCDLADRAPVTVIRGNHDSHGDFDFLSRLRTIHPVRWYGAPGFHAENDGPAYGLVALPWIDRSQIGKDEDWEDGILRLWKAQIAKCVAHAPKRLIVVAHVALKGSILVEGQPPVPTHDPTFRVDDLLPDLDVPMVLLAGHYHVPQSVGSRAVYPGSPFVNVFGEGENRGWCLVDLPDRDAPVFVWHAIPQPARVSIDYLATTDEIAGVKPEMDVWTDTPPAGSHVRIVASFHEQDAEAALANVRKYETDLAKAGCLVEVRCEIQRAKRSREGAEAVAGDSPLEERIRAYAGTCDDPPSPQVLEQAVALVRDWNA